MTHRGAPGQRYVSPHSFVLRHLRSEGSSQMAVDGSGGEVVFRYEVPEARKFLFHHFVFRLLDNGMRWDRFGGLPELENGCLFRMKNGGGEVSLDLMDGDLLQNNSHFGHFSLVGIFSGEVVDMLTIDADMSNTFGAAPFLLQGDAVEFVVRDDLSGITDFECYVKGILY